MYRFFTVIRWFLFFLCFMQFSNAASMTGAGSTLAYPLYNDWANTYKNLTGVILNYQAIGSGAGIKLVSNRSVEFGASDVPLSSGQLNNQNLLQWPMMISGIAIVYNLPGVSKLYLNASILEKIYLGKIKNWNDSAIQSINPSIILPNIPIVAIHRSDGSGTTYIFTQYLSKVSKVWRRKMGVGQSLNWPSGIGGKGSAGVAAFIHQTVGSIGYIEYAYVAQGSAQIAQLQNKNGFFVSPSLQGFQEAVRHVCFHESNHFMLVLTNQSGRKTWPIVGASYILIKRNWSQSQLASLHELLRFFLWALQNGQQAANQLNYVTIPNNVIPTIRGYWLTNIKALKGKLFEGK